MKIKIYVIAAIFAVSISFVSGKYIFKKESGSVIIFNPSTIPFDPDNSIPEGPEDAEITIVEFSDLECPYSIKAYKRIKKVLNHKRYNGKIKYYFKSFPLKRFKNSSLMAKAVLASGLQGKSAEMRERLFYLVSKAPEKGALNYTESITKIVNELGLDERKFRIDSESDEINDRLLSQIEDGKKHSVHAVPTVFINGHMFKGTKSINTYKAVIDRLLLNQ